MVQEGDTVFHIPRSKDLHIAEERIEYFQENALEDSDIHGFHDEHNIE